MRRFILKRLAFALVTLIQLSVIIFLLTSVLPGDPGRLILGPFADQASVDALNRTLGADRPLPVQYWEWISGVLTGDLGLSYAYNQPVSTLIWDALARSVKLAALAFLMVIPLSIFGGVLAALKRDQFIDRLITTGGLALTAIPEFVTGIILVLVFGLWLGLLPVHATPPAGSSLFIQVEYLFLPALTIVIILFGYIARITRAKTIDSLEADYTRTAFLKGLSRRVVIRRHVLRNSLLPTIAVIAVQVGYAMGSLVVTETLFNYPGLGRLIFRAATQQDFPLLASAVLVIGIGFIVVTLIADFLYTLLDPRVRAASFK